MNNIYKPIKNFPDYGISKQGLVFESCDQYRKKKEEPKKPGEVDGAPNQDG